MVKVPGHQLVTDLMLELLKTWAALRDVAGAIALEVGTTLPHWEVLAAIMRAGEALTVPQIARELRGTRQGIQKQVDHLVAQGLLVAGPNPSSARSPRFALTPAGRKTSMRATRRWARVASRLGRPHALNRLREGGMLLRALGAALEAERR